MKLFLLTIPCSLILLVAGLGFGYQYFYENKAASTNDTIFSDSDISKIYSPDIVLIKKEKNYQHIASRLDSAEQLNDGRVGFTGAYTWEFACYEQLSKVATDAQLIYLLKHKKPVVRAYAFKALAKRKKDLAKANFQKVKNDTTTILVMRGCMITPMTISSFAQEEIKY